MAAKTIQVRILDIHPLSQFYPNRELLVGKCARIHPRTSMGAHSTDESEGWAYGNLKFASKKLSFYDHIHGFKYEAVKCPKQ